MRSHCEIDAATARTNRRAIVSDDQISVSNKHRLRTHGAGVAGACDVAHEMRRWPSRERVVVFDRSIAVRERVARSDRAKRNNPRELTRQCCVTSEIRCAVSANGWAITARCDGSVIRRTKRIRSLRQVIAVAALICPRSYFVNNERDAEIGAVPSEWAQLLGAPRLHTAARTRS